MSTPENDKIISVGHKLKKAQHILRIHMDDAIKPLALTTPQYAVLSQLESNPGISNAALARASFITPQTMHGIVSNLEKANLVQRKCDPQHGRILCTDLTIQGRNIVKKAHILITEVENKMTITLNQKNKLLLEKLLMDCVNNLSETK